MCYPAGRKPLSLQPSLPMSPTYTRPFNNTNAPRLSPLIQLKKPTRTSPIRPPRMNNARPSCRRVLHALTPHIRASTLNRRWLLRRRSVPTHFPTFMAGTCGVFSPLTPHPPPYSTQIQYPTGGTLHLFTLNLRRLLDFDYNTAVLGRWHRRRLTPATCVMILGGHRTTPPHTLVDSPIDLTIHKFLILHSRTIFPLTWLKVLAILSFCLFYLAF